MRAIVAVKNSCGRLDNLAITVIPQLLGHRATLRLLFQLLHVPKHPLNPSLGGGGFIESDVVRNGVQVAERRFGPDYFSHRDIRLRASA